MGIINEYLLIQDQPVNLLSVQKGLKRKHNLNIGLRLLKIRCNNLNLETM